MQRKKLRLRKAPTYNQLTCPGVVKRQAADFNQDRNRQDKRRFPFG